MLRLNFFFFRILRTISIASTDRNATPKIRLIPVTTILAVCEMPLSFVDETANAVVGGAQEGARVATVGAG